MSSPAAGEPSRWSRALGAFAIALLAIAPLLPTLRAAFVYDDTTVIRDNATLRGWSALGRVWSEPYWPSTGLDGLGLYRPLHSALLALVWNASGGSPKWFHIYALALAALTTLAVWSVLRRGTAAVAALAAAAWFAAHPLHVEAVASVANSSELLVALCTTGLVWALARSSAGRREWTHALIVGALAAAALSAKESGLLAVPVAALTAWGWRRPREPAVALMTQLRSNRRALMAAVIAIVTVLSARLVALGAAVSHGSIAAQGLDTLTTPERVIAMISLWPRVVRLLVWPASLSPYYGPTIFPPHRVAFAIVGAAIVAAAIGGTLIAARRGDRRPLVAVAWMVLTYLPASNLLTATGQILSDRTLFGATIGAAMAVAWVVDALPRMGRRAVIAALVLVIARDAMMSARYAVAWTSHRSLWTRLAAVMPNEHLSYKLQGMDARARGDTRRAVALLSRALTMAPSDRQIRFELGQAEYATGRYAEAARTLVPLMRDGDARAEPGLVALYLDATGRSQGAEGVVRAASPLLHSETGAVSALFLGTALEQLGRRAAADSAYATGLRRNPSDSTLRARLSALRK